MLVFERGRFVPSDHPLQGSFVVEELTERVGEVVLAGFQAGHAAQVPVMLQRLKDTVMVDGNGLGALMDAVRVCSLGHPRRALAEPLRLDHVLGPILACRIGARGLQRAAFPRRYANPAARLGAGAR